VLVDGVRMDEIVEGTVGTLHILAREAQSRSSIRAMKCMPLLVQVMSAAESHIYHVIMTSFVFSLALQNLRRVTEPKLKFCV